MGILYLVNPSNTAITLNLLDDTTLQINAASEIELQNLPSDYILEGTELVQLLGDGTLEIRDSAWTYTPQDAVFAVRNLTFLNPEDYVLAFSDPNSKSNIVLNPTEVDTSSTSVKLYGKGSYGYGIGMQENAIKLLENFASNTPPSNPTHGQLWYNTSVNSLFVYSTNEEWTAIMDSDGPLDITGDIDMHGATITGVADPTGLTDVVTKSFLNDIVAQLSTSIDNNTFDPGTTMVFNQTNAPTGWTKVTDINMNDSSLRVVTGSAGSGGTEAFSATFGDRTVSSTSVSATIGNTTLSLSQSPSHSHGIPHRSNSAGGGGNNDVCRDGSNSGGYASYTQSRGGNGSHTHSLSDTLHDHTLDMNVKYIDVILATKN